MSRVEAAAADRLPWLSDEPTPVPAKRGRAVRTWGAAAILAVAATGFWLGSRSIPDQALPSSPPLHSTATVPLPEPRPAEPLVRMPAQPAVNPAPAPQVRSAPARDLRITVPPAEKASPRQADKAVASVSEEQAKAQSPASAPIAVQPKAVYVAPRPWNPRVFTGAAGRLVQVGAFGSTRQAKRGWWFMVRAYPAVARLPAVVRPARNSKGRLFYRFQVGTTSQAHSEVLCQRMQKIGLSCAVVGLPWKAKVER
jgi:hypothetical protein